MKLTNFLPIKILRFLIFFPICFLAIAIVNWGLGHLLTWIFSLNKFWFFVVLFLLGGSIWGMFKTMASLLVMLASYISPIKWLGTLSISILALVNGCILGYNLWTLKVDYSGWEIFTAIIATFLILELTFALIYGASVASEERY